MDIKILKTAEMCIRDRDDFLCYLAGTTKMTWKQFTAVIVLGKPFSIALYSLGLTTAFKMLF